MKAHEVIQLWPKRAALKLRSDRKLCCRISRWTKHPFQSREDNSSLLATDGNHFFIQLQAHLFHTTKAQFFTNSAISPSDSLPPLPVFLSCMDTLFEALTTKFSPKCKDVCCWEQNTEKLKGAVCIPGSLKHFCLVHWRHLSLKATGA